jgi:UDP-glucose:(heptosyl)LPS alpha-1,3-glucosyltransferase
MRIALLMKRYSLRRGGGEYDLVRLSRSLADRGHEVHLFVHDVEGDVDPRLQYHCVPMISGWAPLKILSFARNAPKEVARTGLPFDVVHAMTQAYPSDLYWNGGGLQINWLPIRYGEEAFRRARWNPRHWANLKVEQAIFRKENYRRIVALTTMEEDQILGRYGVPADRFAVIPNGIDPDRFNLEARAKFRKRGREELGVSEDQRVIAFVGTDGLRKGLPQLLTALARVGSAFEGLLAIAGNDPPEKWKPAVERLGLGARVRFHGREPHIERLYAAADLVALPSIFEGFGNVVPEAMACGCPVLTTQQVGAADFVDPGETGWVLESCRNLDQFADTLKVALEAETDLEAMGQRAAEAVAPFTWDWTVDRLEEVYQQIVEEKKAEAAKSAGSDKA